MGLLAGSKQPTPGKTMNTLSSKTLVNSVVINPVLTAPGLSQKKDISPDVLGCYQKLKLKYVKDVFCVDQLSLVKPITNVQHGASNLLVGARLQNFWQTWLDLGAGPEVVQILREGYTLPFWIWPNLTRSPTTISCYVNPHRNLYLLEALHQLMNKNAIKLVQNNKAKAKQSLEAYSRSEQTKSFPQGGKIQNGDTGSHQDLPPTKGVSYLSRLQGRLLSYKYTGTIQEISEISYPRSDIPVQGYAIRFVHSTHGVHYNLFIYLFFNSYSRVQKVTMKYSEKSITQN